MTRRTERIGEQLRAELARLLREEVTDPRVGLLTLTRVDVAPDLSSALVFWSPLDVPHGDVEGDGERHAAALAETAAGLGSAAGFLRTKLARALPLRRTPELLFRYDPSIQYGAQTLELLRQVGEAEDGA